MREVSIINLILLLVIFECILSQNCVEEEKFEDVKMNGHQDFQVSPGNDKCLKYSLTNIKSHIGFMFFGSSTLTSEVNILNLNQIYNSVMVLIKIQKLNF